MRFVALLRACAVSLSVASAVALSLQAVTVTHQHQSILVGTAVRGQTIAAEPDAENTTPYIRQKKDGFWEAGIPQSFSGGTGYYTQEFSSEADANDFAQRMVGGRRGLDDTSRYPLGVESKFFGNHGEYTETRMEQNARLDKEDRKRRKKQTKALLKVKKLSPGVRKQVLKVGHGALPHEGDKITVDYTGRILDGPLFDSSLEEDRDPFQFRLGTGEVIRCWDVAIKTMRRGEFARVYCGPKVAYGKEGLPPVIGPSKHLQFDIKRLD